MNDNILLFIINTIILYIYSVVVGLLPSLGYIYNNMRREEHEGSHLYTSILIHIYGNRYNNTFCRTEKTYIVTFDIAASQK